MGAVEASLIGQPPYWYADMFEGSVVVGLNFIAPPKGELIPACSVVVLFRISSISVPNFIIVLTGNPKFNVSELKN
jgi:hypothetical protein